MTLCSSDSAAATIFRLSIQCTSECNRSNSYHKGDCGWQNQEFHHIHFGLNRAKATAKTGKRCQFCSLQCSLQDILGLHASEKEGRTKCFLNLRVEGLQNVSEEEVSELARHLSQQVIPAGTEIDVRCRRAQARARARAHLRSTVWLACSL